MRSDFSSAGAGLLSLLGSAAAVVLLAAESLLPGPAFRYYLLLPGDAFPVGPAVTVPADKRQETGDLRFTVVYEQEARLPDAIAAAARPGVRVVPYEDVVPVGTTPQESTEANKRLMDESQVAAAIVALRALGYEVKAVGEGVRIAGTVAGTPGAEALQKGDVIVGMDGIPVHTAVELTEGIRHHKPGDVLALRVRRSGSVRDVSVGTIPANDDPDRPLVGVYVETEGFKADLPFPVEIGAGPVIGPSAGLMFALGIYDALTPGQLGGGQVVAGTGTIGLDGRVGGVEGVAQKVRGAEQKGAVLFLAPKENFPEARAAASTVRVVSVDTFADALAALGASPR